MAAEHHTKLSSQRDWQSRWAVGSSPQDKVSGKREFGFTAIRCDDSTLLIHESSIPLL